ncbi:MAG: hypothetical protein FWE07_00725 [Turicibacter sp.]|nr:hypothetical protein [Turicibacter sp.]
MLALFKIIRSPVKVIREWTEAGRVGMMTNVKNYREKAQVYKVMQGKENGYGKF